MTRHALLKIPSALTRSLLGGALVAVTMGTVPASYESDGRIVLFMQDAQRSYSDGLSVERFTASLSIQLEGPAPSGLVCYAGIVGHNGFQSIVGENGFQDIVGENGFGPSSAGRDCMSANQLVDHVPGGRFSPGDRFVLDASSFSSETIDEGTIARNVANTFEHRGLVLFILAVPADPSERPQYMSRPVVVLLEDR